MSLPQGLFAAALGLALGAAGQASAQGQPFAVVPTAQPAAPALTAVVNLGIAPAAGTVPEFAQKTAAALAAAVAKSGAKQLRPEDLLAMASAGDMPIDARDCFF